MDPLFVFLEDFEALLVEHGSRDFDGVGVRQFLTRRYRQRDILAEVGLALKGLLLRGW